MKISKRNIILGILFILALWVISALIIYFSFDLSADRGTFGDMFGAINSLFSGLALFGIIISILIQQNELNLQRKELSDTRLEFKTNRVTTIMFKQLDYLNAIVNRSIFNFNDHTPPETSKVRIDEFSHSIESFILSGKPHLAKSWIDENYTIISSISTKVVSILDGLDDILESYNLSALESQQMRKIFKMNINPSVLKLLACRSSFLVQGEIDQSSEYAFYEETLREIAMKHYKRISEYGEDD
ncbi:hypothetical protein ACFO3O_17795 [Dokdonia ponticola]|uniref:Phage abortive infection protein n=1 Tax=Dokdonia ponticola TaxID=2041041 RepID=A0ABV9I0R2_9FLAO